MRTNAGKHYNTETLYAQDEKKVQTTTCVVAGEWFVRFKLGMKLRMGQERRQDEAFTPAIIHALDAVASNRWNLATEPDERKLIEEVMSFVVMFFCRALRGEEVPLVSMAGRPFGRKPWEKRTRS